MIGGVSYKISGISSSQMGLNGILRNQSNMVAIMEQISSGEKTELTPVEKAQKESYYVNGLNIDKSIGNEERIDHDLVNLIVKLNQAKSATEASIKAYLIIQNLTLLKYL